MGIYNGEVSFSDAIKEIYEQMRNNSLSVFCGAGTTRDVTNSKWIDIFSDQTKSFFEINNDIYFLADLEKRYYNSENFYQDLKNKIVTNSSGKKSNYIDCVMNLNLNQIWTTNFDNIIESSIRRIYKVKPEVVKSSDDLLTGNFSNQYVVYKLNGSIDKKSTMVITKSDYYDYFKKQRLLFETLKRQLLLDSFLFLGYSFKDELVLNALREIKDVLPHKGKIHYRFAVLPQMDKDYNKFSNQEKLRSDKNLKNRLEYLQYEIQYFYDEYNIKTILVDSHEKEIEFLNHLYNTFCSRNIFIAGSYRNISKEERIKIELFVDRLIYRLFFNGYSVYSGNGRGLGEIVLARASKYSVNFPNSKFINRPYIFLGDSVNKKIVANTKMMKDCNTMIIISGQDDSEYTSKNVHRQYNQFCKQRKNKNHLVIPISITGYAAKEIYESSDFKNSFSYNENAKNFEIINQSTDIDDITKTIVNMISRCFK